MDTIIELLIIKISKNNREKNEQAQQAWIFINNLIIHLKYSLNS